MSLLTLSFIVKDVKDSLKQRLGAKVGESSKIVSKSSIRNRLTLTVESANQGTIKTITGKFK